MRLARTFASVSAVVTAALSISALITGPASATAVRPADSCASTPTYNQFAVEYNFTYGETYDLNLANGTLEAKANTNYSVDIAYVKTGGSTITANFEVYNESEITACTYYDDQGSFTESAGQSKSYVFSNAGLICPSLYAVMYVSGQGYFAIEFDRSCE
jgi:hypothetical protein